MELISALRQGRVETDSDDEFSIETVEYEDSDDDSVKSNKSDDDFKSGTVRKDRDLGGGYTGH